MSASIIPFRANTTQIPAAVLKAAGIPQPAPAPAKPIIASLTALLAAADAAIDATRDERNVNRTRHIWAAHDAFAVAPIAIRAGKGICNADSEALKDIEQALEGAGDVALAFGDKTLASEWYALSRRTRTELGMSVCLARWHEGT